MNRLIRNFLRMRRVLLLVHIEMDNLLLMGWDGCMKRAVCRIFVSFSVRLQPVLILMESMVFRTGEKIMLRQLQPPIYGDYILSEMMRREEAIVLRRIEKNSRVGLWTIYINCGINYMTGSL